MVLIFLSLMLCHIILVPPEATCCYRCSILTRLILSMIFYEYFGQVEEIDDIDGNSSDPFVAAAVANERELDLSEVQKKSYRKVSMSFS